MFILGHANKDGFQLFRVGGFRLGGRVVGNEKVCDLGAVVRYVENAPAGDIERDGECGATSIWARVSDCGDVFGYRDHRRLAQAFGLVRRSLIRTAPHRPAA